MSKAIHSHGKTRNKKQAFDPPTYRLVVMTAVLFILIVTAIAVFQRNDAKHSQSQNLRRSSKPIDFLDTKGRKFPWQNLRLPRDIRPVEYKIMIYPNFKTKMFSGTVKIETLIKKQTRFITLHGKYLNIIDIKVYIASDNDKSSTKCDVHGWYESKELEMYSFEMAEILLEGRNVSILLSFEGKLERKLYGLYLSNYTTPGGHIKYLAATMFEPTGAREAFPCFDEPDMKAKFAMSIVRSKNHISLFNMPLLTSEPYSEGLIVDTFQQSVNMSTYLVAMVVGDYDHVTSTTLQGTEVSVYAPSHQIKQTHLALDTAVKVLNFYNKLFGINYPLPKQDLIAIPDFVAGAMENWGLITFRLTTLLYDPDESSAADLELVVTVIAHELAHQWFGNLVTMRWWKDIWLNEGFATLVQYLGANEIDKSNNKMDLFVKNEMMYAMGMDCEGSSHPISVKVSNPNAIENLFDAISYSKGASLIRMLGNLMGRTKFWDKIKEYLNRYKYANARTEDLWDIFSGQMTVTTMMDTWTKQMGYPVVTMNRSEEFVQVTQERFLLGPEKGPPSKFDYKWYIPFRYAVANTSGIDNHIITLNPDAEVKFQVDKDQVKWLKGNYGMYGYYRVNYEERNWRALVKQLADNHTVFSTVDRAGLLDDMCYLARANKVSQTLALDMTEYLIKEKEYLPWSVALNCLSFIGERLRNTAVYSKFQKYMESLMQPLLVKLGLEDTGPQMDKVLRTLLFKKGLVFGHTLVITNGKKKFADWMNKGKKLGVNLKGEVYRTGTQYGGKTEADYVFKMYKKAQIPSEKEKLLVALCHTNQTEVLQRLLQAVGKGDIIRHQDFPIVTEEMSKNPAGQLLIWDFVKGNWNSILKWFSGSLFAMPGIVESVTSFFSTEKQYKQVKEFFKACNTSALGGEVKASLNRIRMKINWLKTNAAIVTKWFNDRNNVF
ncbi:endoplasmic reticulum aminopeptidase 1-like [Ylistrum balloti]|uniref:endoplasmic reticulum aminopeptidase 1-like n=1 Tax=Ylistrum balloti TaxID=509963 RepID=UPI002905E94E|nr:endoplasmic reticulum aminopeptidase 1-like [Ylistrum balloti]